MEDMDEVEDPVENRLPGDVELVRRCAFLVYDVLLM